MPKSFLRPVIALGLIMLSAVPVRAQMSASGGVRSLGGYGASAIGSYYGTGGGGYIPYMGNASGFVPYRSGQGGGIGVQPTRRLLAPQSLTGLLFGDPPVGFSALDRRSPTVAA